MNHLIAEVVAWKHGYPQGLLWKTVDGVLTLVESPEGFKSPTQAEIDAWTLEYETFLADQLIIEQIAETDKDMARIGEDLIDILISKGVITAGDLPQATQAKIDARKALRASLGA